MLLSVYPVETQDRKGSCGDPPPIRTQTYRNIEYFACFLFFVKKHTGRAGSNTKYMPQAQRDPQECLIFRASVTPPQPPPLPLSYLPIFLSRPSNHCSPTPRWALNCCLRIICRRLYSIQVDQVFHSGVESGTTVRVAMFWFDTLDSS